MTEDVPPPGPAPVVVWGVTHGDRPFRTVQVHGVPVGLAHDITDVVRLVHAAGVRPADLDDPAVVRWVGGDKHTWV
ncbi:hypothetical protein ACFSJS_22150 [Streptomyces desertarenae]|uniref:Uncharacterized protein n=1 Tax=Streptomyces desertarenae TaxID=2666184 RepID=A0ABW4PPW4_9ACTN